MIKELRHSKILDYLKDKEVASVEDMSHELDIALTTLRRDLIELEQENKIIKLHGGAKLAKTESFINEDYLDNKLTLNIDGKKATALKAAKLIKPNSTIFLDAGSNTFYLAKILDPNLNLTIVTNSIANVQALAWAGHQNIYLLGGKFLEVTGTILGFEAIQALKNYQFDLAFVGVNAVDDEGNIYTTSSEHAQIKVEMINQANKTYGLVDESKLHSKSFYKFASTKDIELIK